MAKTQKNKPARLQEALVLFKYMLHLFGCKDLEALSRDLKSPALEGVDDEGVSRLYHALVDHLYADAEVTHGQLMEYDQNIVRHTAEINADRRDKITWKYYQYLSLLFTEAYLDRFFSDRTRLLEEVNAFLESDFNARPETWHGMPRFTDDDLNKVAFWCATGAGKTLLMHIHIKQYQHYAQKHGAQKLNRILILTPNEGLSLQHLKELHESGIAAELFSKQSRGGFMDGTMVQIIDINKLSDRDGDKTVAVESFEGNNLVLVDEGHRGTGGNVWKQYRAKLTEEGFSFEYSATFGQAIAAVSGKAGRDALIEEYGKATLFDYSYRYFYNDGYGKDYRIMNMAGWEDPQMLNMYLTAYLLSLYEQTLCYESSPLVRSRFLISRPLGIFVGKTVNSATTADGREQMTDVVRILCFLQAFAERQAEFVGYIRRLLDPDDGIKNTHGYSLFANSFQLTRKGLRPGDWEAAEVFARETYRRVLHTLFHSDTPGARLHIDKQKGGDEEIGLRLGTADYFGVINVGDSGRLVALCEEQGLICEAKEFGSLALFKNINDEASTVNLLIGSKKFNEGWSSWRVSVMGLMNIGRSEGSEIIQLFGRGVRLKGFSYSLKRSSALDPCYNPGNLPAGIREIETLNIFGVRADYMEAFRKYLEDEGLPTNEEDYETIQIPTTRLHTDKKLKVVRLKPGYDFKKQVVVRPMEAMDKVHGVKVDWRARVESLYSRGTRTHELSTDTEVKLQPWHLSLLDWRRIYLDIERMKNERSWHNMELSPEMLRTLMEPEHNQWYELKAAPADMEPRHYGRDVKRWEEMTIALLRGYIDRAYKASKGSWESQYMEMVWLDGSDPNFFSEYSVEVRRDQEGWIAKLQELREQILSGHMEQDFQIYASWLKAFRFEQHLYYPLLSLQDKDANGKKSFRDEHTGEPLIKVSPVALNVGETTFVNHVRAYYMKHKDTTLAGKELYLLRNESRKGIGFFEANNFYPDFILWINDGEKQHVTFIDPKGIRNLHGLDDPKIQLFRHLKELVEPSLDDKDIVLDSYIVSNTDYNDVSFWAPRPKFAESHVVFQNESNYLDVMFRQILTEA